MSGRPDPKPPRRTRNRARRVEDTAAVRAGLLAHPLCAACGQRGGNAHHVLPRGNGGDDDPANIVALCGSGTARHHGSLHGAPFVDEQGERWTEQRTRAEVGAHIVARRPDTVAYVLGKLGPVAGLDYLNRRYFTGLSIADLRVREFTPA